MANNSSSIPEILQDGTHAIRQPDETPASDQPPDNRVGNAANILNSVQNVQQESVNNSVIVDDDRTAHAHEPDQDEVMLPDGEGGRQATIDAKNFRVMRGRSKEEPDRKRVDSIKRAIQAGREVERVRVYQDKHTHEQFSPNGAHRQKAYDEIALPVPVIIFEVDDARERAELESCSANEENGSGRSSTDMQYQAKKALELLTKNLNRPPKPRELAEAIQTDIQYASRFLRKQFAKDDAGDNDDEPESDIPSALWKILEGMKKIKPPTGWKAGCSSQPVLDGIAKEVRRIAKHKSASPEITPEEIKKFVKEHNLTNAQLGALVEVSHMTVGRWLAGSVKVSTSNARTLRQIMSYTTEQIRTLLDDDCTTGNKANCDE